MNLKKLKKLASKNTTINQSNVETHIIQLVLHGYMTEDDSDDFTLLSGIFINSTTKVASPFTIPASENFVMDLNEDTVVKPNSLKLLLDYLQSINDNQFYDNTVRLDVRPELTLSKIFN